MPKVTPNPSLIQAISGAVGDLVYYQDAYGNFILQRKGENTTPPRPSN
jgi:hypothetical protein